MSADSQRLLKELETAYMTEVAGYHFYNKAADTVVDKKGKNVFSHLAKEELDHIRAISSISDSLKSGKGFLDYEAAVKAKGPGVVKGLPIYPEEKALVKRLKDNQTDLNAVNIGIEIEEKAVDFYLGLLNKAESPDERVLLTKLLEMEKGHLKILRWESEALIQTGFWGDTMEFSVEKEID